MNITHKISTYLPRSGHLCGEDYAHWKYFWHAITSAKEMLSNMRTAPNSLPPAIAFHSIQSVHLSAYLRVTLLVHMCPSLQRFFLSFSFSFLKQKSCSCPFYLEHCWLFPTVDALKVFTSAVFLAGQCSAVFSSQYPYF